jgi:hypothetical protein
MHEIRTVVRDSAAHLTTIVMVAGRYAIQPQPTRRMWELAKEP